MTLEGLRVLTTSALADSAATTAEKARKRTFEKCIMYGFIIKYKDSQTDWVSIKRCWRQKTEGDGNKNGKKKILGFQEQDRV